MKFENPYARPANQQYFVEDHRDEPYYPLLIKLPPSLRLHHVQHIEEANLNANEATAYLAGVIESRKAATTETHLSDPEIEAFFADPDRKTEFLKQLESSVFQSPTIGEGQTAKIKYYELLTEPDNKPIPLAIKYLLTPTAKTLSAAAEHDMLREVERIKAVEERERAAAVERIRVPHPYLHHKNEQIQCYAMEHIDGADLKQVLDGTTDDELMDTLVDFYTPDREAALSTEFTTFLEAMHGYCLHGDIKPANLMIDRTGRFYVIDFGQSVLVQDIDEAGREQLDNLKEFEHEQVRTTLRLFFRKLAEYRLTKAEAATT